MSSLKSIIIIHLISLQSQKSMLFYNLPLLKKLLLLTWKNFLLPRVSYSFRREVPRIGITRVERCEYMKMLVTSCQVIPQQAVLLCLYKLLSSLQRQREVAKLIEGTSISGSLVWFAFPWLLVKTNHLCKWALFYLCELSVYDFCLWICWGLRHLNT